MALGSAGGSGGSSSSSSSNLSALAPPFTVDRFNPKPNLNPLLKFTDSPYAAPFGHTWQYHPPHPSETRPDVFPKPGLDVDSLRTTSMVFSNEFRLSDSESVNPSSSQWSRWQYPPHPSETRPDVFSKPELDVNSTRITSMPLSNDCCYSVSESVNPCSTQWSGLNPSVKSSTSAFYGAEAEPYCPAYVSSVVCKDSPLVSLNESGCGPLSTSGIGNVSSQVDYTESLSGLEYMPQWGGVWNGLAEAKRGKQVESAGSFSSEKVNGGAPLVYQNFMNQGPAVESGDMSTGDAGISYRKSTDGIRRESHAGFFSVNKSDDSLFAQELGSGILYRKSADDTGKEGCTGSFSVGNVNDDILYAQKLGFHPFESSGTKFLGSSSPFSESRPSDPFQESSKNFFNYQKEYGPLETFIQPLDLFVQDSASIMKPSHAVVIRAPAKGASSPARDPVTHKTVGTGNGTNVGRKLLDSPNPSKAKELHVLPRPESIEGSFNTSKLFVGKELSGKRKFGDSIDTTVKGRYASQVTDTNLSSSLSLSLDHVQAFEYTENPSDSLDNHNPAVDSPCWKGAPASPYSPIDDVEALAPHHLLKKLEGCCDLDAHGIEIAPRVNDSTRAASQIPSEGNVDNKTGCIGNDKPPSPNGTSDTNSPANEHRSADGGINLNDAAEGGAVAYHAAENVLCSPSAQENYVEHHQPTGWVATPKMDVPTLFNAIYNLSELLLFNCSADSCGLKEQDQEVLKRVISNLDACLSKKIVNSTPAPDPVFSQQDTSNKIGESRDHHVGKCADQPQQRYQGTVDSYGQFDHQYMHSEKMNYSESGKKTEYIPYFLPSGDNERISSDDDTVQAIKKVLDENFHYEEEMQSQSLLFKNLWLEAEAKLCSVSYRARFDRMRFQMDEYKSNSKKEIEADVGKVSGSNDSPDLKETFMPASLAEDGSMPEGTIPNHSTFSTTSHADDVEASVLARFNMLRRRDDKSNSEEQQQPDLVDTRKAGQFGSSIGCFGPEGIIKNFSTLSTNSDADDSEASVLARFNMLRRRDDKSNSGEQQQLDMVDAMKAEGQFGSSIGGFDPEGTIKSHSTFSTNSDADDVEASVLARFNMLRCRDGKSNSDGQQPDMVDTRKAEGQFGSSIVGFDPEGTINNHSSFSTHSRAGNVEASVLARFNILKRRDDKSNAEDPYMVDTRKAGKKNLASFLRGELDDASSNAAVQPHNFYQIIHVTEDQFGSTICVSGYESMKEFCLSAANDPVIQPDRNGRFGNQRSSGWYDNSSSDWEHVLKDEFLWQK